ncbi:50s ribosomal protein [Cystoisospora suis]|uniref:Large ribosomal subunit protein bL21m n=1 Tax=Cystoisospora suis TaxID=483139 RepID=A0A2C6KPY9_9APIC|nr:50s ribosomal protein [Cystoisospora suis]
MKNCISSWSKDSTRCLFYSFLSKGRRKRRGKEVVSPSSEKVSPSSFLSLLPTRHCINTRSLSCSSSSSFSPSSLSSSCASYSLSDDTIKSFKSARRDLSICRDKDRMSLSFNSSSSSSLKLPILLPPDQGPQQENLETVEDGEEKSISQRLNSSFPRYSSSFFSPSYSSLFVSPPFNFPPSFYSSSSQRNTSFHCFTSSVSLPASSLIKPRHRCFSSLPSSSLSALSLTSSSFFSPSSSSPPFCLYSRGSNCRNLTIFPQRRVIGHRIEIFRGKHRRRRMLPPRIPLHPLASSSSSSSSSFSSFGDASSSKDMNLFTTYRDLQLKWRRTCRQRKKKFNIARKWRMPKNLRPLPSPAWSFVYHPSPKDVYQKIKRQKQREKDRDLKKYEDAEDHRGPSREKKDTKKKIDEKSTEGREKGEEKGERREGDSDEVCVLKKDMCPGPMETRSEKGRKTGRWKKRTEEDMDHGDDSGEEEKKDHKKKKKCYEDRVSLYLPRTIDSCQIDMRERAEGGEEEEVTSGLLSSGREQDLSSSSSYPFAPAHFRFLKDTPQEELFCVMKSNISTQHKVTAGDLIQAEKLHRRQAGDKVVFGTVLLVGSRDWTIIGKPTVPFAKVEATIEEQTLAGETVSFFYRKSRRVSRFRR